MRSSAAARTRSSPTARRSCSWPGAAGASSAGSAPRSTARSTPSTATTGACSASSRSRTTPRSSPRCSTPPRAGCATRGRDRMVGPMDFTMNDESGVLVEGFEREPLVKQPWHPPYYARRLEEAGMAKAMDLFMWELEISDREKMRPILFELAADGRAQARRPPAQDVASGACARRWTASPRSTTPPGARTGTSGPTRRPTSTCSRRS